MKLDLVVRHAANVDAAQCPTSGVGLFHWVFRIVVGHGLFG